MSQPQQKTHTLDAESFGALHRNYHHRLLASVIGMVRDHSKAEEITAKAFQIGWEKREQFRGDSSAYTWLHAIARSQVWQACGQRELQPLDVLADRVAETPNLTAELERQEAVDRLHRALSQIPAVYRRALVACCLNGESTRCVAERERIPVGTVLSRVFTGKRLLRERLETTP